MILKTVTIIFSKSVTSSFLLTPQEMYESETLKPNYQNVLQYFLFSCYTGLRYQDPVQRKTLHNELIEVLEKYRILHEELIECGITGIISKTENKQNEIELYKLKLEKFAEKYILQES